MVLSLGPLGFRYSLLNFSSSSGGLGFEGCRPKRPTLRRQTANLGALNKDWGFGVLLRDASNPKPCLNPNDSSELAGRQLFARAVGLLGQF